MEDQKIPAAETAGEVAKEAAVEVAAPEAKVEEVTKVEGAKPEGDKPEAKEAPKPEKDEEPPTRKTPYDYILERKAKKLEKLKAEKISKIDNELSELDGPEDDNIDPEEEEKIDKVVQKKYGQQFEEMASQKVKADVQEFFNTHPQGKHFKEFEAKILKYAAHPSRAHLPIQTIAFEVAGDKLLRIGAEMAKSADEEAAKSKAGGSPARKSDGGVKDYSSLSNAEMEIEIAKAKGAQ